MDLAASWTAALRRKAAVNRERRPQEFEDTLPDTSKRDEFMADKRVFGIADSVQPTSPPKRSPDPTSPASSLRRELSSDRLASPPKRSGGRPLRHIFARSINEAVPSEFDRGRRIPKAGRFYDPSQGSPSHRDPSKNLLTASKSTPGQRRGNDDRSDIRILQPDTRPISHEQLVEEVKGIYAGLVMVESKCIEIDSAATKKFNEDALSRWRGVYNDREFSGPPPPQPSTARDYMVDIALFYLNESQGQHASSHAMKQVSALVDSGADHDYMSETLAASLGLEPERGTAHDVKLGNGQVVRCLGRASVQWAFAADVAGEKRKMLQCSIMADLGHGLILGAKTLKATETLTTHSKTRIRAVERAANALFAAVPRLHFKSLGALKEHVWGFLNGVPAVALPDTGSDVVLISREYAVTRGFKIDTSAKYILDLELGNGSAARTCGVVKGLDWRFGKSDKTVASDRGPNSNAATREPQAEAVGNNHDSVEPKKRAGIDFYVLDGLPADLVFSNEFLFTLDVFNEYQDAFMPDAEDGDMTALCNIRLIGKYSPELRREEEEYLRKLTSGDLNVFDPLAVQQELARRDRIRDAIDDLPLQQRDAARDDEMERQRRWDEARKRHIANRQSDNLGGPAAMITTSSRSSDSVKDGGDVERGGQRKRPRSWTRIFSMGRK